MTETLKNALTERADAISFDPVDLGEIHRHGDRTLRRRRFGAVAGGLVAAGAVIAATALAVLPGSDGTSDTPVASDPDPVDIADTVWVEGSTVHSTSGGEIDLGRDAVAFVRTSTGFVYATPSGVVYSLVGTESTKVGRTDPDAIRLVSDPTGPLTAWIDAADPQEVVVLDQSNGTATSTLDIGADSELTALDERTAYLEVGRESRSVYLDTGQQATVADDGSLVLDATGDVLALGSDSGLALSRAGAVTELPQIYGNAGSFSPGGTWFFSDADEPQVVSVATGEPVSFEGHRFFQTGYEWYDDDTLMMIAMEHQNSPAALLSCEVPTGACVKVLELDTFDELEISKFVAPVGDPMDW